MTIDIVSIVSYIFIYQFGANMLEPNVITITELARTQKCSRQAIYNAIERGDLNTTRLGTQTVVVKDAKYEAYQVKETGGRLHKRYVEKRKEE